MHNNDVITLKRSDLAKFMSMCGQTIVSTLLNVPLTKKSMENSYEAHMEKDFMENTIAGISSDYDNFYDEINNNISKF